MMCGTRRVWSSDSARSKQLSLLDGDSHDCLSLGPATRTASASRVPNPSLGSAQIRIKVSSGGPCHTDGQSIRRQSVHVSGTRSPAASGSVLFGLAKGGEHVFLPGIGGLNVACRRRMMSHKETRNGL